MRSERSTTELHPRRETYFSRDLFHSASVQVSRKMKDPNNFLNPGHFACEERSTIHPDDSASVQVSRKMKDPLNNTRWRCGDLNPGHFACEANALPLSYTPDEKPTFLEISIPFCKRPSI
ncbi:hypothetical protein TNCV_2033871 [Trichonephila clavipes]|nr:hypothetical protein TNCV_2033871 [Trichonephila clavipes]